MTLRNLSCYRYRVLCPLAGMPRPVHLGPLTPLRSLAALFCGEQGVQPSHRLSSLLLFRSIFRLLQLIKKGVLPQAAKPPEDILLLPALDYLEWIGSLPQHLQYQVIHFSPSCSIKTQKGKVCLWGKVC